MISLRYGTPPIVRHTGGLADTIADVDAEPDRGTGFVFEPPQPAAFLEACRRAIAYRAAGDGRWDRLLDRGMAVDFDWRHASAPRYLEAYRRAIAVRAEAGD
jgi:starch synthase